MDQDQPLHFIMFPMLAQGHMIPAVDMARLFAQQGVVVTIVMTPKNALRFKTTTDRAQQSSLPIRILELRFPNVEVGLPEGCENADTLPSPDSLVNFFIATAMLREPLEKSLQEMEPRPSCIISDFCLPWTSETARKFDIPRLIFHGISCFSLFCSHNILHHKPDETESITSESEPFVIPGLPDRIEITKSRLPGASHKLSTDLNDLRARVNDAELTAYGVVINSFYDLEPLYIDGYQKAKQDKVWCVGPVSQFNKEVLDKFERGNKASIDENLCLKWLDSRQSNSVIYVCLGSLCRLTSAQFQEIGLGLEASNYSFIWVIRSCERYKELEKWLSEEGFEERTKDRSLIIKGWAPQVLILSHQAIGGFLTHCGWNSTLEGVCAGVPMITCPMFAEQFLNEKLVVQILGIGVEIGVTDPVPWAGEDNVRVSVSKEDVEKAIYKLTCNDDEGVERRKKAMKLAKLARVAMEEGGSSYLSMILFINDIREQQLKKTSCQKQNNVDHTCH
ncbi:hypothetical protein IFM89_033346 [Coptis chinensis]|uniref:Glycosyltransferase n=1 Tax=Coptis chinensis TaxID=261450 RepID=A0A835HH92_9MAGN|nr:hypothetical protein IFM89_033346 [Coptis chinensis]